MDDSQGLGGRQSQTESESSDAESDADNGIDADDAPCPLTPDTLLTKVQNEKQTFLNSMSSYAPRAHKFQYVCSICTYRVFSIKNRLVKHLNGEHGADHCCCSSKQLRIMQAQWEEACAVEAGVSFMASQRPTVNIHTIKFLEQSAKVMRAMLESSPSFTAMRSTITQIDALTTWVVTEAGVKAVLRCDAEILGLVRLSQKLFTTKQCLQLVFALALDPMTKASVRRVRNLLFNHYANHGAMVPFLLPHRAVVWALLKHCAESFSHVVLDGHARLAAAREFQAISFDGTFKYLMSVMGQPKHGQSRANTGSPNDIHVVATCRSKSGCIFFSEPFHSEDVCEFMPRLLTVEGLQEQVQLVQADRPDDWDNTYVFGSLPSLDCVAGDPWHVVFDASLCFGESMKPALIIDLRKLQHKWSATGSTPWLQTTYFRASSMNPKPLTDQECRYTKPNALTIQQAKTFLKNIDAEQPWTSRLQYLKGLAALLVVHEDVMERKHTKGKKKLGSTKKLGDIIRDAMDAKYIEHLANGSRWRAQHGIARSDMAPGTTGNEGAHFDMKGWARNVVQQTPERARLNLTYFTVSQLGRFHANQQCLASSGYRADKLQQVLLKIQMPQIFHGSAEVPRARGGLSRAILRKCSLQQLNPQVVGKKPLAVPKRSVSKRLVFKKPAVLKRPASHAQRR